MKYKKVINRCLLVSILILATVFRLYGINWDQGHHLHPDERMITMVAERIHLPKPLTLNAILTPDSSLNPKFFPYGSLPLYLLKIAGNFFSFFNPVWGNYSGLHLVGRLLSVFLELGTIIIIFKISQVLLPCSLVTLLPSFFYALSVLAIQTAHFYVVDVPLTFFTTLTLYSLVKLVSKPSLKMSILTGIAFGLSLASKVSSILLIAPILVALMLIFLKERYTLHVTRYTFLIFTFSFLIFALTMPYTLIDFQTFKAHTLEQSKMTKDAFIFPYTLQYVGTTPYLYHLKNLVLWGMGVPLGLISIVGVVFVSLWTLKWLYCHMVILSKHLNNYKGLALLKTFTSEESPRSRDHRRRRQKRKTVFNHLVLLSFFWPYFLITGSFAVKFMRYLLPIYPLFCIFGGLFLSRMIAFFRVRMSNVKAQMSKPQLKTKSFSKFAMWLCGYIAMLLFLLWPLSFLSIYLHPHTRVAASEWINKNIRQGSTLSVEHWDDRVPMWGDYQFLEMPMYEPDDSKLKWEKVNSNLEKTDYIIIASNRLYVPLMKLTNCQNLPPHRCYPKTAEYYQKLFSGQLGFTKVAEFTSYPILPHCQMVKWLNGYMATSLSDYAATWLRCYIADDSADESFTVYDHPKIMIFKKSGDFRPL